jgi:phosphatidylglycerol:prolipoprotein diacylglycerol transferase
MYPELLRLGPFTIYSYGMMVALGFLAGTALARRNARRSGLDPERITDLCFTALIAGLAGARLMFVATDPNYYLAHPLEILMVWRGGLVFYGGLLFGVLAAVWFVNRHQLAFGPVLDVMAPTIVLGHAFGRLGCFLNGCCYGRPGKCGVVFPALADNLHRQPIQLYESFGLLVILAILLRFGRRPRNGGVFVLYLALYGILRFVLEFWRADDRGLFIFGLSPGQFISIIAVAVALTAGVKSWRRT